MTGVICDVTMHINLLVFHNKRLRLLWLVLSYCVAFAIPLSTIVDTDKGKIRGYTTGSRHKRVNVYTGIPFAKPPIGNLRFKHPVPNDAWSGILNATVRPNACMQLPDVVYPDFVGTAQWNPNTNLSEDCLYLNVWTPVSRSSHSKKAVMVWFYGGGFMAGSASLDIYDGTILAAEADVVVVNVNYRVGALGFISFGHYEAPGNAGMFDQLMALDWVQKNIRAFGGDPYNVTLFGESAGSVSVSLHLLSPLSRLKFNRAILQSGVANLEWGVISRDEAKVRAKQFAKVLDCEYDSVIITTECLRAIDAKHFPPKEYNHIVNGIWQFAFVPIVDGTFVVEIPLLSLRRGHFKPLPILIGTNANEGTWVLPYFNMGFFNISNPPKPITEQAFNNIIHSVTDYFPRHPYRLSSIGKDAIKFQYTPWQDPSNIEKNRDQIQNLIGDYHMICGCTEFAYHYALSGQNVFYYSFNHRSTKNKWPKWMGVMHGDEIHFVFGLPLRSKSGFHKPEKDLSRKIIKFWSNYAKTGNPNHGPDERSSKEWPLHKPRELKYLALDTKLFRHARRLKGVIGHGPRIHHCAFWREYLPQLIHATIDSSEAEIEWKRQFHTWSTEYIVDWKMQFDNFITNRQKRYQTCMQDGL